MQGGAWSATGTGSTYSRTVGASNPDFEVRVTVTSAGMTASDTHFVDVNFTTLAVNITGTAWGVRGETRTWYANATGGTGSYSYQWQQRSEFATTWTNVGTNSPSYTRTIPLRSFYLRVVVTSGTATASDEQLRVRGVRRVRRRHLPIIPNPQKQ